MFVLQILDIYVNPPSGYTRNILIRTFGIFWNVSTNSWTWSRQNGSSSISLWILDCTGVDSFKGFSGKKVSVVRAPLTTSELVINIWCKDSFRNLNSSVSFAIITKIDTSDHVRFDWLGQEFSSVTWNHFFISIPIIVKAFQRIVWYGIIEVVVGTVHVRHREHKEDS